MLDIPEQQPSSRSAANELSSFRLLQEAGSWEQETAARLKGGCREIGQDLLATGIKLGREVEVFGSGMVSGLKEGYREARQNPLNTGIKVAGSALVGLGLGYFQERPGIFRLAAEALGVGLSTSFKCDILGPQRWGTVKQVWQDTWNSAQNIEKNQAIVARNLGHFAFDTGLMTAGGLFSAWGGRAFKGSQLESNMLEPATRNLGFLSADNITPAVIQQKANMESFLELADNSGAAGAGGKEKLFEFLSGHPELEAPIRQYAALAFGKITSGRAHQLVPADLRNLRNQVSWIDEFYKSSSPNLIVESNDMAVKFQQFAILARPFHAGQPQPAARDTLNLFLRANPNMVPIIKQFACSYDDEGVVAELDRQLNTRNLDALRERRQWRTDALAATKAAQAAADTQAPPAVSESRPASPDNQGGTVGQSVDSSDTNANPSVTSDAVTGQSHGPADSSSPGGTTGATGRFDPSMIYAPAHPRDLAQGLSHPDLTVRGPVVRRLADHLNELTDDEFKSWMQTAPDGINRSDLILSRPEVKGLDAAVLKNFLSKSSSEPPVPDWAKPFIEENAQKELQKAEAARQEMEKARAEGKRPPREYRAPRPPRPFDDTIGNRLELLDNVITTFQQQPKIAQQLLELGTGDKGALKFIVETIGKEGIGPAHKSLLLSSLPYADSIEPVKYMFQFLKERDEAGAYAAALRAKPRVMSSLEELEDEIMADTDGEELSPQDAAQYADQLYQNRQKKADQDWQNAQNLINSLATGKIKMPPKQPGQRNRPGYSGNRRTP